MLVAGKRRKMDRLGSLLALAFTLCAVKLISGLTLSSSGTTEANVGDTVEFTCRVTGLSFISQQVKWAKIGNKNATFTKEISSHISVIYEEGHYEVTATQEGEDQIYTFKINDVGKYDDGAFKCFVEEEGRVIDQTKLSLTVRQAVASLELSVGPYKVDASSPSIQEFEMDQFDPKMDQFDPNMVTRCLVEGSNPAPQVMFKIGEEDITAQLNRSDQKQVKGKDLESIRYYIVDLDSTGTYPLDTSLLNKAISCSAWIKGDEDNKLEAQALLKVKQPPNVECSNVTIQVGDRQVALECTIKSLTTPEQIRWFVDGENPIFVPATDARRWEYRAKARKDGENQVKVLLAIDLLEKKHLNTTYVLTAKVSPSDIEHAVRLHFNPHPLKVRLVNGPSPRAGRVEVYYNNAWGTVCVYRFDLQYAQVVCRMLGFPTGGAIVLRHTSFGKGTGPFHLSNVTCGGYERNLLQCSHNGATTCDHSEDHGVECPDPHSLKIRVVNGPSPRAGRVEVYYFSTWGTICDDGWDNLDAQVVCRMLGFPTDAAMAHKQAFFGEGTGLIHLDSVECRGDEANLLKCRHTESMNCEHSEDAGVECPEPPSFKIRLVDGPNPRAGRVEVYIFNAWGTVCDDDWDSLDAQVACRMLGFPIDAAVAHKNAFFGIGKGLIHMESVECIGNETNLWKCRHTGNINCKRSQDAGVECPETQPLKVRLANGPNPRAGRVEIYHNNAWGTVCGDEWNSLNAQVICRMLDFPTDAAMAHRRAFFGRGTGRIHLSDVRCRGYEANLLQCSHAATHTCYDHSGDAGVECPDPHSLKIRLVNGPNPRAGRVEVYIASRWGTVCHNFWDSLDARVVCRMLGFPTNAAMAHRQAFFGRGTGRIHLDHVKCRGNETDLWKCSHIVNTPKIGCGHSQDAGVECPDPHSLKIRLVNGSNPRAGQVEVYHNDAWGTVCDEKWDSLDAQVVCRMLGFPTDAAMAHRGAFFGTGTGLIHVDSVGCRGNEANIWKCRHFGNINCKNAEGAGVACPDPHSLKIRLVNGENPREGRVEVYYNNAWGTVCDRFWDDLDAYVVCRMLGFPTDAAVAHRRAFFGRGTGLIHLDNVKCRGNETKLWKCSHTANDGCGHSKDAGVVCPEPHSLRVRLVNGPTLRAGRVEVFIFNSWGTVCGHNFDNRNAQVVCRMLGFPTDAAVAHKGAFFGKGTGLTHLDNVKCEGNEPNLWKCSHTGEDSCGHSEDAGVECPDFSVGTMPDFLVGTTAAGPIGVTTDVAVYGTTAVSTYVNSDIRLMATKISVGPTKITQPPRVQRKTKPSRVNTVVVMTRESVYIDGQALTETRSGMVTVCARLCSSDNRCARFNYNQVTGGCRLFSKNAEVSYKTKIDWTVWDAHVVP